jgi:hypothetical protein
MLRRHHGSNAGKRGDNHRIETWDSTFAYKDALRLDEMGRRERRDQEFVARWSWKFPWSLDLDTVIFIQHSRRRGMLPHAAIDTPNCKIQDTKHKYCQHDCHLQECQPLTTRHESLRIKRSTRRAGHLPPNPLVEVTLRWRKSKGNLFRCGAVSFIDATPQEKALGQS